MYRLHWFLAVAALATWIPSYVMFFHRDFMRWWRGRAGRRDQARKERAEWEAAQARLRDELAAKYMPPPVARVQPAGASEARRSATANSASIAAGASGGPIVPLSSDNSGTT